MGQYIERMRDRLAQMKAQQKAEEKAARIRRRKRREKMERLGAVQPIARDGEPQGPGYKTRLAGG